MSMQSIALFKKQFQQNLKSLYDDMEIESFFNLALQQIAGLSRLDLALNTKLVFADLQLADFENVSQKLQQQVPIQYILGQTNFYGLDFFVNPNVLIPRPETEELVDWIVNDCKSDPRPVNILDLGTGSGCIAISLKKNIPNATVSAIDISKAALEIARKNADQNLANVNFKQQNILEINELDQDFDIIVSNPPYVRHLEKNQIQRNVLDHEPHLALFVDDNDALIFYKKIATLALKHLTLNGKLFFEINQYLSSETVALLHQIGFEKIELRKDIYGNDRMIKASRT